MAAWGFAGLIAAFACCAASLACLGVAHIAHKRGARAMSDRVARAGRIGAVACMAALTLCCGIIVWCFFAGDISLDYVVRNRSNADGGLGWLFKLAGLWAGRAGSLLFWAWLIAVFCVVLVFVTRKRTRPLDNGALAVAQLVLLAFVGVLLFSPENMPFTALDARYLDEAGGLNAMASMLGMNTLLEHWAMAIHPPTLFIGYAGLTIPFAYAISALVVNDDSDAWVRSATPYLMFSWLLLGAGIGLGAVWAYVVLGWGGYWGWDPVENASLLPWLIGVALIHSFTIYRKRGEFKRWSIMCACLAFSFVVLGTFITRSGIVQSVHAFGGDSVSLTLFLVLIVASLAAGAIGLLVRRKSFGVAAAEAADIDSLVSRDAAYYVNNVVMVASAVLLAYLTVSSALPAWLPFGGQAVSADTYNLIARPLGVAYCALIAVCPLLGWRKTEGAAFCRKALAPALCAGVLFCLLMIYFLLGLLGAGELRFLVSAEAAGCKSGFDYAGFAVLTMLGFMVACLLVFNAAFMAARALRGTGTAIRSRFAAFGGAICHLGMGVILVGLIGSSMYVDEKVAYLPYDAEADAVEEPLIIEGYELTYTGQEVRSTEGSGKAELVVHFDVTRDGQPVGSVSPAIQMVMATQQQKLEAGVLSFPLEDLFVVFRGTSEDGALVMDVRVNPLIDFVWVGFALLMAGAVVALLARRSGSSADAQAAGLADDEGAAEDPDAPSSGASGEDATASAGEDDEDRAAVASAGDGGDGAA